MNACSFALSVLISHINIIRDIRKDLGQKITDNAIEI